MPARIGEPDAVREHRDAAEMRAVVGATAQVFGRAIVMPNLKPAVRTPTDAVEIRGATTHNLRDVDVDIPLGVLVVITGVAGSGKSSLIHGSIPAGAGVVSIDQGAIHGSRRSNPATYTGLLDPIRKAFAKANGVELAWDSFGDPGATQQIAPSFFMQKRIAWRNDAPLAHLADDQLRVDRFEQGGFGFSLVPGGLVDARRQHEQARENPADQANENRA